MEKIYASTSTGLKEAKLDDAVLASTGRLIRACAEIEDIVTLRITKLAALSNSHALILLGRSSISAKLQMAETLATVAGDVPLKITKSAFAGLRDRPSGKSIGTLPAGNFSTKVHAQRDGSHEK